MPPQASSPSLPLPALCSRRRPRGKVAHLPKAIRDQINELLRDGLTYPQILNKLGDDAKDLNRQNLGTWQQGGYQLWLKDQVWLQELQAKLDFAGDVLRAPNGSKIHEASLRIAVKQMYDLLAGFDPASLAEKLAEEPAAYASILNALAKLTETALKYDHQHAERARHPAPAASQLPNPEASGLSESTRFKIEEELNLIDRSASSGKAKQG